MTAISSNGHRVCKYSREQQNRNENEKDNKVEAAAPGIKKISTNVTDGVLTIELSKRTPEEKARTNHVIEIN